MSKRKAALSKLEAALTAKPPLNYHGCIAHPCKARRAPNSGFCYDHGEEHNRSPWVKAFRKWQEALRTNPNAQFSPPKRVDKAAPVV